MSSACPPEGQLAIYLQGLTSEREREPVREHIASCELCHQLLEILVRDSVPAERDPPPEGNLLPRGTLLGRYEVLEPIGRGAMGVVYSAHDPQLNRKVALKLLRADVSPSGSGEAARMSLLQEAQTLARLSHPNVVTVFDAGAHGDEVFFAMELVSGSTLREAVAARPKSWRRALALYFAAGEGLAAAHRAGLVHRDFKPDNALVPEDGRVRVTDFGLAAAENPLDGPKHLAGTPAYMAPEQREGRADARADQYAFCVSLHEALHGARPSGPARNSDVPVAANRVLARGLRENPAERWPSMDALLTELRRATRPVPPLVFSGALMLLALTLLLWGQHGWVSRRIRHELDRATEQVPQQVAKLCALEDLRLESALQSDAVLEALERASNLDVALGLAPGSASHGQLEEANGVLRSADLRGLKSSDWVLLLNAWGRVVYNLADERAFGAPMPAVPGLEKFVFPRGQHQLWSPAMLERAGFPPSRRRGENDLMLMSARPVFRGEVLVGSALSGRWLAGPLLDELGAATGAEVGLQAPDGAGVGHLSGQRISLGDEEGRVPLGAAYLGRSLTPIGWEPPAWMRWGLLGLTVAAGIWMAIQHGRASIELSP